MLKADVCFILVTGPCIWLYTVEGNIINDGGFKWSPYIFPCLDLTNIDDIYNSSFCIKHLTFIRSFYWTKSRDRILLLALQLNIIKYLTLPLKQDNTSMNLLFPLHTSDITMWMINTSTVKIMGATEAAFEDLLFSIMRQMCFKRRFICIFSVLDKTKPAGLKGWVQSNFTKVFTCPELNHVFMVSAIS